MATWEAVSRIIPARSSRMRAPRAGKTESQPRRASPARSGNARACGSAGVCSGAGSSPSASLRSRSRTDGGIARSPVPATARFRHCASSTSTAASIAAARCAARACTPPPLAATRASVSAYASSVSERSRRSGRAGTTALSSTGALSFRRGWVAPADGGPARPDRVRHLHNAPERKWDTRGSAKRRPVSILTVHLWVAFVVVFLAVAAVWRRSQRRMTVYVVTVQVLLGAVLVAQGLRTPWYHPALAVLGWSGYMAANAAARRDPASRRALAIAAVSSLLILTAFYAGRAAIVHAAAVANASSLR